MPIEQNDPLPDAMSDLPPTSLPPSGGPPDPLPSQDPAPDPDAEIADAPKLRRRVVRAGTRAGFERLLDLVDRMIAETQQQFVAFRVLRLRAVKLALAARRAMAAGEADAAASHAIARADLKAAVDGLAMIVRALERLDQMARSLKAASEQSLEARLADDGYEEARKSVLALIERRANEIAEARIAALKPKPRRKGAA